MLDVDEFKSYNDRYGHPAGDEALELIGNVLRENLRGADVAARYGGEEFSVLLPETSVEEAEAIAERIRRHVEVTKFPKRKVTVSIGIAPLGGNVNTVKELVKAADLALYEAKRDGRNNVKIYNESMIDAGENVHYIDGDPKVKKAFVGAAGRGILWPEARVRRINASRMGHRRAAPFISAMGRLVRVAQAGRRYTVL
jgi:diguanylate cyclase (GGDEF)-like protein